MLEAKVSPPILSSLWSTQVYFSPRERLAMDGVSWGVTTTCGVRVPKDIHNRAEVAVMDETDEIIKSASLLQ